MNENITTESSLPLPDNGRKIQVGDISFVYKNTYHPIYWVGDEPYRPRVETLVIRNGKDVFLRMYDSCEEGSMYRYRLPGGSLDNDSTKEQQAENETNEEALLSISEIHNTGLSYYHYYEDGKLLKGGDICIKYKGTISDIFIAKYKGKVDKSTIEKHDLDNDMATNGKFYPIIKVCQLLRPEHIEAIMNSGLVDDNVKGSVRLILRGDKKTKIPEAPVTESVKLPMMLYHGGRDLYDELRPTGIDFGNAFQKMGWSLFCWTKYSSAIGWGVFSVLKHLKFLDTNITIEGCKNSQTPIIDERVYNYLKENLNKIPESDRIFYVYSVKPKSDYKLGLGHSSNTPNCITVRKDHIKPDKIDKFVLDMKYIDDYCTVVPIGYKVTAKDMGLNGRASSFLMTKDYMYNHKARKPLTNAHNSGELVVGDDIEKYAKDHDIPINKVKFSKRMHDILHESVIDSRHDITSKFLEKGDTCANLQNWDPVGYNILYVTGLSGSGKTTLATDMKKEFNCYRIELDYIAQHLFDRSKNNPDRKYKYSKKIAEEAPSFVVDWLSVNYNKYSFDTWKDSMDAITDFTIWMDTTHRGDGNLYIINGAWIPEIFDATYFTNRPIIVKGSSYLKTAFRRVSRDFKDDGSIDKKIEWFIKNLKTVVGKGYRDARHHVDYFSDRLQTKAATVESTNLSLWGNPVPKNVTLYHASPVQGIKYIEPRQTAAYKDLGPVVFSSRYKSFAACFGTYWDDTTMKQGTDPDDLEKASMWIIDKAYDWSKPCSMYILENDGSFRELVGHPHEYISPNKIKVKKEIKFNSYYAMVKAYDIEVFDYATKQKLTVTESTVTEMTTTSSLDETHKKEKPFKLSSFKKIKITRSVVNKMKKIVKSLSHIRTNGTDGYIYMDDDNPVAVIVVETKENGEKWIQALEVFGKYKNHGLSGQLLDVAVDELHATELSVNKKNDVAYALYKKHGFKDKSETDTMYMMTLENEMYYISTEAKSVGANTTGMKRSELPDEMFGIPSQRKYELDTEKHVRSAIKLFNWVDPKYEEELATNIIKRMKYFNIIDVNVGPKNRFGKYYKGGNKK